MAGSTKDLKRPLAGKDPEVNSEDQTLDEANKDVPAEISQGE